MTLPINPILPIIQNAGEPQGHKPHVRKLGIEDRFWHVPPLKRPSSVISEANTAEQTFIFPGWQNALCFGNDNPVHVEYCSGNGAWIIDKAMASPHINYVAVEMENTRVYKIWRKTKRLKLSNLLVVNAEAFNLTRLYFPQDSISEIFINFPDPWPKRRHAKYRLIQPAFVAELARILKQHGRMTFVTDDAPYAFQVIKEFRRHPAFASLHPDPFYVNDMHAYGTSYFDDLWRQKGKVIHYIQFEKIG